MLVILLEAHAIIRIAALEVTSDTPIRTFAARANKVINRAGATRGTAHGSGRWWWTTSASLQSSSQVADRGRVAARVTTRLTCGAVSDAGRYADC
jgi:hypothetical protein